MIWTGRSTRISFRSGRLQTLWCQSILVLKRRGVRALWYQPIFLGKANQTGCAQQTVSEWGSKKTNALSLHSQHVCGVSYSFETESLY